MEQEELLWFQKSRVKWYKAGEKNTKFFYLSTICRRRRNKISMLKNDDGDWVLDQTVLKSMVKEYYARLFTEDTSLELAKLVVDCPRLPEDQIPLLDASISMSEVKRALFQMKPCQLN